MRRCAFLTMECLDGFVSDDELAHAPLRDRGWTVEPVPWRRAGVAWERFDVVVIRTTWDYHQDPQAFFTALEAIVRAGTPLANPLGLVRWNLHKTYLRDLAARGVSIVPTAWEHGPSTARLRVCFDELGADELVVKPVVGANADDTYRLPRGASARAAEEIALAFRDRECLVQPFMRSVVEEGEFSVFYFGGAYSHTILKTPKARDFRVQEEHGGLIRAVEAEPALLESGQRALAAVQPVPLYARADFVRDAHGRFVLMELELIEPSLYFRTDPAAPARFARALDAWLKG